MISRPIAFPPRRSLMKAATGLAGILSLGKAPAFAQAQPKKLVLPSITPPPEASGVMLKWFADQEIGRAHV